MHDRKNLYLAISLSLLVIVGWMYFVDIPRQRERQAAIAMQQQAQQADPAAVSPTAPAAQAPRNRADVLAEDRRIPIETDRLHGSLRLKGARLDDLTLRDYAVTVDDATEVTLLSPNGTEFSYFADLGWAAADGAALNLPNMNTPWETAATRLAVDAPVELTWDNGQGLVFTRTVAIDHEYMVTVTQSVRNTGTAPVSLQAYGSIERHGQPGGHHSWLLHEGPMGVADGVITEYKYADLMEDERGLVASTGGWFGITDKYWLVALLPDQARKLTYEVSHRAAADQPRFYVNYKAEPQTVEPGATLESTDRIFAGAKRFRLLKHYADEYNVPLLEYAVDFGWFWFLTVPFLWALLLLYDLVGNFGIAILIFTVFVKLCVFPLANKSYRSMSRMKKLEPQLKALREQYPNDRQKMGLALTDLYKRENVNPLSGCLPLLVQIPIFFSLYKVLFVSIEMRHEPFFGWIQDLSEKDPTSLFNLFGLLPFDPPTFLHVGAWPILMGISMWALQMMQPKPADPAQDRMMQFMPVLMTFMLAAFPAGLVIYWTWSNILSVAQMSFIMWTMGVPVGRWGHARAAKKAAADAPAKDSKDKAKADDAAEDAAKSGSTAS